MHVGGRSSATVTCRNTRSREKESFRIGQTAKGCKSVVASGSFLDRKECVKKCLGEVECELKSQISKCVVVRESKSSLC